jgi:site-specific recombinase XerD
MNTEKNKEKWIEKCVKTLEIGGRSKRTIDNYKSAWDRYLNSYSTFTNIKSFDENKILDYLNKNFKSKNVAADTYNMNLYAIKYFYSVNFKKSFNKNLLPKDKKAKYYPEIISKELFLKIINEEKALNHKCWLLLAFCCGLRVEEISKIKIEDIDSKNHKLKVHGKRNKDRFTILPDVVIKLLRIYYKSKNYTFKKGYLFKGIKNNIKVNEKSIINYFTALKKEYNLPSNLTFHSLRHSFATYYLMNGGNLLSLKEMLGHSSITTTTIYVHMSQNFNDLEGINYV